MNDGSAKIILAFLLIICTFSISRLLYRKLKLGKSVYKTKGKLINGNLAIGAIFLLMTFQSVISFNGGNLMYLISVFLFLLMSISYLWMGNMKVGIRQGGIISNIGFWNWSDIESYKWNENKIIFQCRNKALTRYYITQCIFDINNEDKEKVDQLIKKYNNSKKRGK